MQPLKGLTADLLSLLLLTIVTTVLSVVVPNWINQFAHRRAHNGERVWEEVIARLNLAYVSYIMAVTMVADVGPVYLRVLYSLIVLFLGFWLGGLKLCFDQERRLPSSVERMDLRSKLEFLRPSLAMAVVAFVIVAAVAVNPMKRRLSDASSPEPQRSMLLPSPR